MKFKLAVKRVIIEIPGVRWLARRLFRMFWGLPSYDADALMVWHKSTDFLKDPQFINAYRAGLLMRV